MSKAKSNKSDESNDPEALGLQDLLKMVMEMQQRERIDREEQRVQNQRREEREARWREESVLKEERLRLENIEREERLREQHKKDIEALTLMYGATVPSNTRPIGSLEGTTRMADSESESNVGFHKVDKYGKAVHPLVNADAKATAVANNTPIIVFRSEVDTLIKSNKDYNMSFGELCSDAKGVKNLIEELIALWGKG